MAKYRFFKGLCVGALTLCSVSTLPLHANEILTHSDTPENLLIASLRDVAQTNIDSAIDLLQQIIKQNPNFKLAQMVYADLLLSKTQPLQSAGELFLNEKNRLDPLIDEARARWNHHNAHPDQNKIPKYILKLRDDQRYFITVDLSSSRLYLFENTGAPTPKLIDDFYISMGKNGPGKWIEGDKKTPIGVYFILDYLRPEKLPEFYGHGAFPLNYPNSWDRLLKRTGDGIWLHGNPLGTFSRPPRDSDGCVTVANKDLDRLKPFIQTGKTPFIIANGIDWSEPDTILSDRDVVSKMIETWRVDWESRDSDKYLSHYSRDFAADNKNYSRWADYKRTVNSSKSYIKVNIDNMGILQYPGDEKVVVIDFEQTYESDNFRSVSPKRQYWKLESDGRWRIFYEGSV